MARTPQPAELTWRSIALGGAITLLFTAANAYLGLKVGLPSPPRSPPPSFPWRRCSACPVPRFWRTTLSRTIASAAGNLSAIIFVLRDW